jgi:hypothetical protein
MALYEQFGGDPPKKKSEQVIIKRLLNKRLSGDDSNVVDIIRRVAGKAGLSPSFLAANALQEGMNLAIMDNGNDEMDQQHEGDLPVGKSIDKYPINGFLYYGLDTFGDSADVLKKKGYIPSDFDYAPFERKNEKNENITTAAFKNNEDALLAKAAYIRHFQDQVKDYSAKKNLKLGREALDYMTMSAYNGGMGNAIKMMDEMSTGKVSQKEFIDKGMTSRKGVHKNIVPRIEKMKWIDKMISGPVAPSNPFPMVSDLARSTMYK